jgi:hypothetical protein
MTVVPSRRLVRPTYRLRSRPSAMVALAAALAAASVWLVALTPCAAAQGGASVATAPLLVPGQTVSGNTASDTVISHSLESLPTCTKDEELWTLNLTAGEKVLLKGQNGAPASDFQVQAVPPGVTETALLGDSPIAGVQTGSLSDGLSFAAARSGTWLIALGPACGFEGHDGPYQLAATLTPPTFVAGTGGGNTIATAVALAPGKTFSGNTAADAAISHSLQSLPTCTKDEELWTLNLTAGEKVLLNGQTEAPASDFQVEAVPPGVSEPTLLGVAPVAGVQTGSLSSGLSFAAARSGTWLIAVGPACGFEGHDGPYQLAATVTPPTFVAGTGGGDTIATAPLLGSGQTVSGNTAADAAIPHSLVSVSPCTKDEELWTLSLAAGDKVLLKGQTEAPASDFQIEAIPPGVSEPTLLGVAPIAGVQSASLTNGLSFAAPKSGTWLIVVGPACGFEGHDGPYQLTTSVIPLRPLLSSNTSKLVVFRGSAGVEIGCRTAPCAGEVELTKQIVVKHRKGRRVISHRKTVILASASFSLAAGKSETVHLRLTSTGKRLLAHAARHHLTAKLVIAAQGASTIAKTVIVS